MIRAAGFPPEQGVRHLRTVGPSIVATLDRRCRSSRSPFAGMDRIAGLRVTGVSTGRPLSCLSASFYLGQRILCENEEAAEEIRRGHNLPPTSMSARNPGTRVGDSGSCPREFRRRPKSVRFIARSVLSPRWVQEYGSLTRDFYVQRQVSLRPVLVVVFAPERATCARALSGVSSGLRRTVAA